MSGEVVKVSLKKHIAVVAMEDRESGNTFTERLMRELTESFAAISQNPDVKVVVLHGYDNFFCSGSPKKILFQAIDNPNFKRDIYVYELLLKCELPVISAMQGHALGAGFAFGAYADIIVMGEECIYSANFMKYGFTPDSGASYIIPEKFGKTLGNEMLFRAENYFGRDLKARGVQAKIVPKKDVISTAIKFAEDLADKPLLSLKLLKQHLIDRIRLKIDKAAAEEVKMQDITFTQPEVAERIEKLFGGTSKFQKI